MLEIVTGFEIAAGINAETRRRISASGRSVRCVVLLDDSNPGMAAYTRRQQASAEEVGIDLQLEAYPSDVGALTARLETLAALDEIDAVATLYPLPAGMDARTAALLIGSDKDVDGLHPLNAGDLALGAMTRPSATAKACLLMAQALDGSLRGREIVLVGASRIVARPLANMLLDAEATVTIAHAATRDLAAHTRRADIVVTAAGVAGLIGSDHLSDGAIVLDVSINRGPNGLVGDVDLDAVAGRNVTVTHVPDGVGPVTTACLMRNVADAALGSS
ncbi:bifunctional 5,10-methylenetetrahydrofolate dehydrogenase/5,10-methenyltetrahydrofolate cyclohydrolase [Neorhizobium sp. AL 9.2.2]|uniref:bifunctional 5,10-methylenetetrahydrofolate dehydrogenase/5,10-methenyltetrahydrofolate cyclohydrolase n=1 Tax=Neorhizobium sp. AL 9.2.2 TaxID=2712894 RepID=UPI001571966F|nr:bifunctional 5,10-methylenetetrahydrofolate dehydrogenase/5,10-methenyltetrahydrofolate cyclohydrolase [Neorhizobium sp. AL 9.2.2]NSY17388.1 bifunctional 5,10-methylenetetrahydrofolate dehydrogenase/5,10-methenyltetrahydrofolate cyclohydrolase [Neorhizobium sp. AL 9.2.2]